MKTSIRSFALYFSLLLLSASFTSCDGLVETEEKEIENIVEIVGQGFEIDVRTYDCNSTNYSLLVTSPGEGPIEVFRDEMYKVEWKNHENITLSKSIWLECIRPGKYLVTVTNRKNGLTASEEVVVYDKI